MHDPPRILAVIAALAMAACSESPEEDDLPTADEAFDSFMEHAVRLPDGRLIIDGDIGVNDEAEARAYFEAQLEYTGLELEHEEDDFRLSVQTINGIDQFWSFPARMQLTYCVDTASFGTNADALVVALERAAQSWSNVVGVRFERMDASPCDVNASVTFHVLHSDLNGANADAFFPSDPRSERKLEVDDVAFTTNAGGRDLEGILRHELGHILGFRHEHIWITCTPEGPNSGGSGARQLTPYDVDSVMHYPQCGTSPQNGYRQTEDDYRGAASLYGLSPALHASTRVF
jgi:hypothetical protein